MSEIPPGAVTTADLYRELVGMRQDITRALERLAVIDSRNQGADQIHGDHETRLRAIESWRWKAAGAATTAGIVAGGLGSWIGIVLSRK